MKTSTAIWKAGSHGFQQEKTIFSIKYQSHSPIYGETQIKITSYRSNHREVSIQFRADNKHVDINGKQKHYLDF